MNYCDWIQLIGITGLIYLVVELTIRNYKLSQAITILAELLKVINEHRCCDKKNKEQGE